MARKKTTGKQMEFPPVDNAAISKSQRVRDYLKANPKAKSAEVVEALKEFKVTKFDVSNVVYAKPKKKKGKPGRKPKVMTAATVDHRSGSNGSLELATVFVESVGGLSKAINLLESIQRLK